MVRKTIITATTSEAYTDLKNHLENVLGYVEGTNLDYNDNLKEACVSLDDGNWDLVNDEWIKT